MSRPIKITPEMTEQITEEFLEALSRMKLLEGKIDYHRVFKWDTDQRARLGFSAVAFAKMFALIHNFDSEVAWHGTARRSTKADNVFNIDDIFVYPQTVTNATVNTDQIKYQEWLMSFDDETFPHIRMQGHSHVNMSTSPSGVDLTHQQQILDQLDDDMFYIFMIWNKKHECNIKIFDLKNNTLYETKDIDIYISGARFNFDAFLKDAKDKVSITKPTYGNYGGYNYSSGYNQTTPATPKTEKGSSAKDDKPKNRADIGKDWGTFNGGSQQKIPQYCE